jgi:uncharacterized protein (TIGR00730 family)
MRGMTTASPRRRCAVFCGSSPGNDPSYRSAAEALGDALLAHDLALVYGGATCGLMGAVADRVMAGGGEAHGVIPRFFAPSEDEEGSAPRVAEDERRELAHRGLTSLVLTETMHERKVRMIEMADFVVNLPGGFGTLDEAFEVLTLAQLGAHAKPSGFVDVGGYYRPLLDWVDGAVTAGFVRSEHRDLYVVDADPAALVALLLEHPMPRMPDLVGMDRA